jgi:hypothetical protein
VRAAHAAIQSVGSDLVGGGSAEAVCVSVTKLPSGRWRAQVHDPTVGHNVSVSRVLGGPGTFATKTEAKRAREQARERLREPPSNETTLSAFWERWTTDPLFARPKESMNIHNRERTKGFAARYGARPIDAIDDAVVAEWLTGGERNDTVPALRAMFNDAASAKAGRIVRSNPFARLGISRGPGRRHEQPPSEEQVWRIIRSAHELTTPSFAAWLQSGGVYGAPAGRARRAAARERRSGSLAHPRCGAVQSGDTHVNVAEERPNMRGAADRPCA